MKKTNKKLITLLLAGAISCSAVAGGAFLLDNESASAATPVSYSLTDVFLSNGAISAEKKVADGVDVDETATFTLGNNEYVRIKRDLPFKWFVGKNKAEYLTMQFALKDLNFKTLTFKTESTSSVAAEDEKAVNVVKFKNVNGVVSVAVISDGEKEEEVTYQETALTAGSSIELKLSETMDAEGNKEQAYDEYLLMLNGTAIGSFKHLGTNFAEYVNESDEKMYPLEIKAETEAEKETTIFLEEINNQRFDNITGEEKKMVKDTAPPVLVVNEELNSFQLGAAFSLNYEKMDILQSSSLTESKKYYQYNPNDTEVKYEQTLTTSTYFMETTYVKEGKDTTVYREFNDREFVSIQITLGDNTFNDTLSEEGDEKAVYDLAWYAEASALHSLTFGEGESAVTTEYIIISNNESNPYYKYIVAENGENKVDAGLKAQVENYNLALQAAASKVYAGSNAYIYFPSVDWLIDDDNGYRNLRFSISYKTATSSAQTSTNLAYNNLKLSASKQGVYEFKILAHDEAGNAMMYYNEDGKLVEVTTSNIWDIEEIPSFKYTINNQGLKVKEGQGDTPSEVRDVKTIGSSYSFSGVTIVGATTQKTAYQLYRVNLPVGVTQDDLAKITYEELGNEIKKRLPEGQNETYNGDYFALYLDIYKELLAKEAKVEVSVLENAFEVVSVYNDKITEEDGDVWEDNRLEWQKTSDTTFTAAVEGTYIILADYWEELLPTVARTSAYKVIVVESEVDKIKGETEWLKNNLVSVILFSVAAVMLIIIIVLLLIKPSDETLEDVDKKATIAKKKAKKEKKNKK